MNKILTLTLMLMFSVTSVSAAYNFDYVKPNLYEHVNPIFELSKQLGSTNPISLLLYMILTDARFLETKLYQCEAELAKQKERSCGGSHRVIVKVLPEEPEEPEEPIYVHLIGDANCDGVVSAADMPLVQQYFGTVYNGTEECALGDANNDGVVSAGDYATVQENFGNSN